MLDTFLRLKPTSREEWLARIPYDLRSATDPEQVGKYLDEVLEIVSRIEDSAPQSFFGESRNDLVEARKEMFQLLTRESRAYTDDQSAGFRFATRFTRGHP